MLLKFGKKLQQSCQNFILYAKWTFWGKIFVLNKSLITELFLDCEWKISAGFFKQLPTFSEEVFYGKSISFQKIMSFPGLCRNFFRILCRNVLGKMFKTAFQLSRGAWFLEKTAFLKMLILSQLPIWSDSCSKILRQLFASWEKIAIQVTTETYWRNKVLFLTETIFFSFTDFDRCIFEHSKIIILSVLSKRHSTYPEERLDEISSLQRIRIVLPFPDFESKMSWLPAWKLRHSCRNCSCVSRLRFPFNFLILKKCAHFIVLFVSWLIQLHFCWFFLGSVCKTALYLPEDLFEAKLLVLDFFFNSSTVSGFERKLFGLMKKTVRQPCQKCTFSASGTKRGEYCFEKM